MPKVDLGSVLRLNNGNVVVVIGIIDGGFVGTFYTVIEDDVVREINKSEIKEVISER